MSMWKTTVRGFRSIGAGLVSIAGGITSICLSIGDVIDTCVRSYIVRNDICYVYDDDDTDDEVDVFDSEPTIRWRYVRDHVQLNAEDAELDAELDSIFAEMDSAFKDIESTFDSVGNSFDRVGQILKNNSSARYQRSSSRRDI